MYSEHEAANTVLPFHGFERSNDRSISSSGEDLLCTTERSDLHKEVPSNQINKSTIGIG